MLILVCIVICNCCDSCDGSELCLRMTSMFLEDKSEICAEQQQHSGWS